MVLNSTRRRFLQTIGSSAPLMLLSQGCGNREVSYPPLSVLIVIDTLRTDHLSLYGYERDTTPYLKTLSKEMTVYDWCVSPASWTIPTMLSLFTGDAPRTVIGEINQAEKQGLDRPVRPTLCERLKNRGVTCAGFIANDWVAAHSFLPLGFDRFETKYTTGGNRDKITNKDAKKVLADTLACQQTAKRPLFTYTHLMDTHQPLSFEHIWDKNYWAINVYDWNKNRYDGCIRYVDEQIETYFNSLKREHLWDSSLIVITADHGEHLGKRYGLKDHGNSVYEELIRVPLLIKLPGQKTGGRVIEMTDLRSVYRLLLDPDNAHAHFQSPSVLISETLSNFQRKGAFESLSASRSDGIKLITYLKKSPDYRKWEMFYMPSAGNTNENLLGCRHLVSYQKVESEPKQPIILCKVLEKRKVNSSYQIKPISDISIPADLMEDSDWEKPVEANIHNDEEFNKMPIFFGNMVDYVYRQIEMDLKKKDFKIQNIRLKDIHASIENNKPVFRYKISTLILYTDGPLPTSLDEIKQLADLNKKIIQEDISLEFKSSTPLLRPLKITDPAIHPSIILCDLVGDRDSRIPLKFFNTPDQKKALGHGSETGFDIEKIYIGKEQKNFDLFYELKINDKTRTSLQAERELYIRQITTQAALYNQACTLTIPRYLKEYFKSLDVSLLREKIIESIQPAGLSLVGLSPISVLKNDQTGKWIHRTDMLCTKSPIYPYPNNSSICEASGITHLTLSIESENPLIGNIDRRGEELPLWLFPSTRKFNRVQLVVSLYEALQRQQLDNLDDRYRNAFQTLSTLTIDHIKENGDAGNPLDHVSGVTEESLRALGYL